MTGGAAVANWDLGLQIDALSQNKHWGMYHEYLLHKSGKGVLNEP